MLTALILPHLYSFKQDVGGFVIFIEAAAADSDGPFPFSPRDEGVKWVQSGIRSGI